MKLRDAPLVALMMALAAQYPRYGYRRIAVFMERGAPGAKAESPGRGHSGCAVLAWRAFHQSRPSLMAAAQQ